MENFYNKDTMLAQLVKRCKIAFNYMMIFGCIYNLLMLALPIYSLQVLDRVISSGNLDTLLMITLIVASSVLAMVLLGGARSLAMKGVSNWLDSQLNKEIFIRGIYSSAKTRGSSSASQYFRELENIRNFISGQGIITFMDAPWAFIFIIVLFCIHPVNGYLAILGAIILVGLAILGDKTTKKHIDAANEQFTKSMHQMDLISRNSEAVIAMAMSDNLYRYWHNRVVQGNALKDHGTDISNFLGNITKYMRFLIQIGVTGLGGYLVVKGQLTSGAMIAGSILVGRALSPFEAIVSSWKNFIITRKSYIKLEQFLEYQPYTNYDGVKLPEPSGKINVLNLSYSPGNNQKLIIQGLSFTVEPGEVIAIVGESAAGKSTLARLLVGILPPTSGYIKYDNIDAYKWNHNPPERSLGQYVGYLPQDIELFNGSIKMNIARMEQGFQDEKVISAAQHSKVHDMIMSLPEGYNTNLGIEGIALSGGQKQRIALARAFYNNPKIMVLDEPNANLDKSGEELLFQAIHSSKEYKITTIIISHRLSILGVVDKIMYLSNGKILDFLPRDEMIEKYFKPKN